MESKEEELVTSKNLSGSVANSGIQIYLRIRPSTSSSNYIHRDDVDLNKISFKVPKQDDTFINNSRSLYTFQFHGILDEKVNQKDVFRTVGIPAVNNALDGYNSTIFAYGQTGSGKTFTITGGPEKYENRGITPRAISHIFKTINNGVNGFIYSCYVSYLEIYNQYGYDLLSEQGTGNLSEDTPKVTMLEDENGIFHFKNLSVHVVSSEKDALNLLFLGDSNRAIAATEMNQNSTRSHCIFTIILEGRKTGADTVTRSKLNIVDLAGSERVSRTSSAGQTLREAKYINSSLFFLEMVIVALQEKEKKNNDNAHIPYRNSMMTSVLRDSLGGNCKTAMIATISPEPQHTDESISTCSFAQRVALVKNSASINEKIEPEMVIQRLRAEVRRLREEVGFLQGKDKDECNGDEHENYKLPQHEINELTAAVEKYVQDPNEHIHLDFCGGITLPKIRVVCAIFKDMILSNDSKEILRVKGDSDESDNDSSIKQMSRNGPPHNGKDRDDPKGMTAPKSAEVNDHPKQEEHSKQKLKKCFDVPVCSEEDILNEPDKAFSWFKDRYPGLAVLEESKILLKNKYLDAKNAGNRVEEIRSRISFHKDTIEKLRRDYDIGMISPSGDEMTMGGEKLIIPGEKFHSDAINKEKIEYKETLEYLRKLKTNIEHLQAQIEKGRLKLQTDFDVWYHEMCIEGRSKDDRHSTSKQSNDKIKTTDAFNFPAEPSNSGVTSESPSAQQNTQVVLEIRPQQKDFQLPPGIKLTGNKEADDDIIAFFKAKQALLARPSLMRK